MRSLENLYVIYDSEENIIIPGWARNAYATRAHCKGAITKIVEWCKPWFEIAWFEINDTENPKYEWRRNPNFREIRPNITPGKAHTRSYIYSNLFEKYESAFVEIITKYTRNVTQDHHKELFRFYFYHNYNDLEFVNSPGVYKHRYANTAEDTVACVNELQELKDAFYKELDTKVNYLKTERFLVKEVDLSHLLEYFGEDNEK